MIILQQTRGTLSSGLDADALTYIRAVEAADGQALETAVRTAYNIFIKGCKADGIWNAISGACILAGARTLSGALVPLRGNAPTNFNFVSADYNRKTGLISNGSTKYLDSGVPTSSIPEDTNHAAIEIHTASTLSQFYMGILTNQFAIGRSGVSIFGRSYNDSNVVAVTAPTATGFAGFSRSANLRTDGRFNLTNTSNTTFASGTPPVGNVYVFAANNTSTGLASNHSNGRLRFYSIGNTLGSGATGLTNFNNRISTLMSAINSAIP